MKILTGEKVELSDGATVVVHNEQDLLIFVGETVSFEKKKYRVLSIIPPTKPEGKWSLRLKRDAFGL